MLSAVVLSKPCGRSNTHRAQRTLKGEGNVRGREEEKGGGRETAFLSSQSHFYSVLSYPQQGRFIKPLSLSQQARGWQLERQRKTASMDSIVCDS